MAFSARNGNGLVGFGCYLVGLLLWFPSVSVLNIGEGSSVQPVVAVGVLVAALMVYARTEKFSLRFLIWFGSLIFLLIIQAFTLINKTGDLSLYFKGMTSLALSLFMLALGYLVAKQTALSRTFFNGYVAGGLVSSFWAITQYFFWSVLKIDFPFLVGIQNSLSFAKYATNDSYIKLGRGFACTPEPSILFVLLAVCLALLLYSRRSVLLIFLVLAGILSTASAGIISVLPLSLVFLLYVSNYINAKMAFTIFVSSVAGAILFIAVSVQNMNLSNIAHDTNIIARVSNISNNASFLSRTNSMLVALEMFNSRPLLGWGVQSEEIASTLLTNSTSIEENKGINSLLLSMLVWFGSLFTIICMYPVVNLFFKNDKEFAQSRLFVVITLIGAFISISYYNLYNIWFAFGMAAHTMDAKSKYTKTSQVRLQKQSKDICTI